MRMTTFCMTRNLVSPLVPSVTGVWCRLFKKCGSQPVPKAFLPYMLFHEEEEHFFVSLQRKQGYVLLTPLQSLHITVGLLNWTEGVVEEVIDISPSKDNYTQYLMYLLFWQDSVLGA